MAKGIAVSSEDDVKVVATLVLKSAPRNGKDLIVEEELHQNMVRDANDEPLKNADGTNQWIDGDPYSYIQLGISQNEAREKSGLNEEVWKSALARASKSILAAMKKSGKYSLKDELVIKFTGGRGRTTKILEGLEDLI